MNRELLGVALVLISSASAANADAADTAWQWPNGAQAAVNLSYDDALSSQLDNALPALDKYGLKATFNLVLGNATVYARLADWRAAAANGHELANHTLFHQCSRSVAGHEWVTADQDLDHTSVAELVAQIRVGNSMLHAIDGRTERTFAAPCGDLKAAGEEYLPAIRPEFIAIKSLFGGIATDMKTQDPYSVSAAVPSNVTGKQLIAMARDAADRGTMINFTFHGVGGDYLAVSNEAHEELLAYLAANRRVYWTDTFLNIMKYVKARQ